ncbi:hypothetical protein PV08_00860 [Exophiala spinifera]|uniref:Uncharacterized protein n=1 Tax=Exophiala spinifera TaxID=91928 RepID=A0A0D2BP32_9EURO|nr:uncharacterized protein PV08_00860 [Exophiala spinifera]KIW20285.1 hypothetical protein PV08_00860 [Exophiala spinifera]
MNASVSIGLLPTIVNDEASLLMYFLLFLLFNLVGALWGWYVPLVEEAFKGDKHTSDDDDAGGVLLHQQQQPTHPPSQSSFSGVTSDESAVVRELRKENAKLKDKYLHLQVDLYAAESLLNTSREDHMDVLEIYNAFKDSKNELERRLKKSQDECEELKKLNWALKTELACEKDSRERDVDELERAKTSLTAECKEHKRLLVESEALLTLTKAECEELKERNSGLEVEIGFEKEFRKRDADELSEAKASLQSDLEKVTRERDEALKELMGAGGGGGGARVQQRPLPRQVGGRGGTRGEGEKKVSTIIGDAMASFEANSAPAPSSVMAGKGAKQPSIFHEIACPSKPSQEMDDWKTPGEKEEEEKEKEEGGKRKTGGVVEGDGIVVGAVVGEDACPTCGQGYHEHAGRVMIMATRGCSIPSTDGNGKE